MRSVPAKFGIAILLADSLVLACALVATRGSSREILLMIYGLLLAAGVALIWFIVAAAIRWWRSALLASAALLCTGVAVFGLVGITMTVPYFAVRHQDREEVVRLVLRGSPPHGWGWSSYSAGKPVPEAVQVVDWWRNSGWTYRFDTGEWYRGPGTPLKYMLASVAKSVGGPALVAVLLGLGGVRLSSTRSRDESR
jgi:hypothetical protein